MLVPDSLAELTEESGIRGPYLACYARALLLPDVGLGGTESWHLLLRMLAKLSWACPVSGN